MQTTRHKAKAACSQIESISSSLSIHPVADQLSAWWSTEVFKRNRKLRNLPVGLRSMLTLDLLHQSVGFVRKTMSNSERADIRFDPCLAFGNAGDFAQIRRQLILESDLLLSAQLKESVDVAATFSAENIRAFSRKALPFLKHFQLGEFVPLGWDEDGRLEFVILRGSCYFRNAENVIFTSLLGARRGETADITINGVYCRSRMRC